MKREILKPVSEMPSSFDVKDWNPSDIAEDYSEQYRVDVDDETLERILEGAVGKIEVDGDIVIRYMPECGAKSEIPMFLCGELGKFYKNQYSASSGTHGILFEGRRLVTQALNLFNRQTRRAPPENNVHMMRPGYPAPNWCLEVEWESKAEQARKGFLKVTELFSFVGGNNTRIEEVWLLVYPQNDEGMIVTPAPLDQLPIIAKTQDRPTPGSKYLAIFVRDLDLTLDQYVDDADRPLLVGYYLIEVNKIFRVPAYSLLSGAPDINTNQLLDAMGYVIQFQDVHK
eukprot:gene7962-8605_t